MKKKILTITLLGLLYSVSLTGCFASWGNDKALKGGYFTNNNGNYIVINYSGSAIMDMYILKDVFVESEAKSDGLRFKDNDGNGVIIQGDAKIIRFNNGDDLSQYVEYHREKDIISYEEFYNEKK